MENTAQQTGSTEVTTGNPQNISAQGGALQNASPQSVEQIRALDQSSEALRVSNPSQEISLSSIEVTGTTEVQVPQQTTTNTAHIWLYAGVGLAIVLFGAFLVYGLFKPHHAK